MPVELITSVTFTLLLWYYSIIAKPLGLASYKNLFLAMGINLSTKLRVGEKLRLAMGIKLGTKFPVGEKLRLAMGKN